VHDTVAQPHDRHVSTGKPFASPHSSALATRHRYPDLPDDSLDDRSGSRHDGTPDVEFTDRATQGIYFIKSVRAAPEICLPRVERRGI